MAAGADTPGICPGLPARSDGGVPERSLASGRGEWAKGLSISLTADGNFRDQKKFPDNLLHKV